MRRSWTRPRKSQWIFPLDFRCFASLECQVRSWNLIFVAAWARDGVPHVDTLFCCLNLKMWFLIICIESQMSLLIVRGDRMPIASNHSAWWCLQLVDLNMVYTCIPYALYLVTSMLPAKNEDGSRLCNSCVFKIIQKESNCIQLIALFFSWKVHHYGRVSAGVVCATHFFFVWFDNLMSFLGSSSEGFEWCHSVYSM